jgi:hypothetical protein
MPDTIPNIDYTSRDFTTIKNALIANVQSRFPNDWKDFTESNIGMAWLEIVAYVFDSLNYQLDVYANENYISTARDRESVVLIGQMVGYILSGPTSASVVLSASIETASLVDIAIEVGTLITSANNVIYEIVEEQIIPAGQTEANITAVQGQTLEEDFESDGTGFQEFRLSTSGVIEGSITVTIDGSIWDLVDSLVYSTSVDQSYSIRYDVDDYVYIKFGDNVSGLTPPNHTTITITYRVGGGVIGNCAVGDINSFQVNGLITGTDPAEYVPVSLTNTERGSGGNERETIDHAKFWIPKYVTTNGRAVTAGDFDTLASLYSSPIYGAPAYAKCRLKQRIPELNTVEVFLWARDSEGDIAEPSSNLINAVQDYFDNNGTNAVRIITVDTEVKAGNLLYFDISAIVTPDGIVSSSDMVTNVRAAINSYFTSATNQPGVPFRISRIYNLIQNATGVSHGVIELITASYFTDEVVGTSNGVNLQYDYTTQQQPLAGTVTITCGSYTVTDDGNGSLVGNVEPTFDNTIDYQSGVLRWMFPTPAPANGTSVTIEYRYPLSYQRGETTMPQTFNGVTRRFRGKLRYAPLVPSTVAFTDGTQNIVDDGNGNLTGDIYDTGINTIDYDTGSYDISFYNAPSADQSMSSVYQQLLSLNFGDIPVNEDQLAVSGFIDVSVGTE